MSVCARRCSALPSLQPVRFFPCTPLQIDVIGKEEPLSEEKLSPLLAMVGLVLGGAAALRLGCLGWLLAEQGLPQRMGWLQGWFA